MPSKNPMPGKWTPPKRKFEWAKGMVVRVKARPKLVGTVASVVSQQYVMVDFGMPENVGVSTERIELYYA